METETVLIVDDSAIARNQLDFALRAAGFSVLQAVDAKSALGLVDGAHTISAIVCDVNMPGLSGLDFLDELRGKGLLQKIAVVMLTSEIDRSLVDRAKSAGAKGWMRKPADGAILAMTLRRLIRPR